jgi:hypothetical protein
MPKKVPAHLRDKARKCIFCNEPGVTETHIFPDWLNRFLSGFTDRTLSFRHEGDPLEEEPIASDIKQKQGSLFSQKPHLACDVCNNGWMNEFEDEVLKFIKPILRGEEVALTNDQTKSLAGWLTLIGILSHYMDGSFRDNLPVSASERSFLKKYRIPPDHWSIVAASSTSKKWYQRYRCLATAVVLNEQPYPATIPGLKNNTHITSFGMGKLFIQIFACPLTRYAVDFEVSARANGFVQIWPIPSRWLFAKRLPKFPTKLVLDDEGADNAADSFQNRFRYLTYRR